jgi:hypothetical protein
VDVAEVGRFDEHGMGGDAKVWREVRGRLAIPQQAEPNASRL